jgi:hypothetical protein
MTSPPAREHIVLGEIHTDLLPSSSGLTAEDCRRLLAGAPAEFVRRSERPIQQSVSPEVLTGVACRLPSRKDAKTEVAGTVSTTAVVIGGRVLQCASTVRLEQAASDRRLDWSHYLAKPGVVEVRSQLNAEDAVAGFLDMPHRAGDVLDLGGISARVMAELRESPLLDAVAPFPTRRIRLRWAARKIDDDPYVSFTEHEQEQNGGAAPERSAGVRALRLELPQPVFAEASELCRVLALQDWLLTELRAQLDDAGIGREPRTEVVRRLGPPLEHLVPLWPIGIRLGREAASVGRDLDRRSGWSRQWDVAVARVRDQVALAAVEVAAAAVAGEK